MLNIKWRFVFFVLCSVKSDLSDVFQRPSFLYRQSRVKLIKYCFEIFTLNFTSVSILTHLSERSKGGGGSIDLKTFRN